MKKSILALVTGLVVVTSSLAQQMPGRGSRALSFTFSGLDDLGIGTIGGGFGFKYWLSSGMAVAPMINLNLQGETDKSTNPEYTDVKISSTTFGLGFNLEWHLPAFHKISPYIGGGLGFSVSSQKEEPSIRKTNPSAGTTKSLERSTGGFSIAGIIGAEYFFNKNISLAGHYQFSFGSTSQKSKRTVVAGAGVSQPAEEESSMTELGISTTSLILNIYF